MYLCHLTRSIFFVRSGPKAGQCHVIDRVAPDAAPPVADPAAEAGGAAGGRAARLFIVPFIVASAFILEQIDSTIVTIAIPQISRSLTVSPLKLDVLVTSYIISVAIFLPISGWAADRFGARRVFCWAIALFTVSSVACGFATRLDELVAGRLIQGIGGAMMTPVGRLILLRSCAKRDRVTAMSYMLIPIIIGPALGPPLGGLIIAHASWRWIFFVNIPVGLLAIACALRFFERGLGTERRPFDFRGFVLAALGSALFMFGVEAIAHRGVQLWSAFAAISASAVALSLYVRHARRHPTPVLDLSLFREKTVSIGMVSGALCRMGMNAPNFLLPFLLQIAFGLRPMQAGMLMFASTLGVLVSRFLTRHILARLGLGPTLSINAAIATVGLAGFALATAATPPWGIGLYLLAFGVVRTIQYNSINSLIYSELDEAALSRGTSLAGVAQQLATAVGVTISVALLAAVAGSGRLPTVADFRIVMLIVAAFPLLSLIGFLRLRATDGAEVSGYRGR